jgi:hypothetical protein
VARPTARADAAIDSELGHVIDRVAAGSARDLWQSANADDFGISYSDTLNIESHF